MRKKQKIAYYYVFGLIIVFTKFFDLIYINKGYVNWICLFILLCFFCITKNDNEMIRKKIGFVTLLVFGSCFYSLFVHHQNFYKVVYSSYFAFGLLFFCIPLYFRLNYHNCILLIRNFCILYCICYVIQWLVYPTVIFSSALDEFSINEKQFRMRMTCSICSYCLFFYGFNQFLRRRSIINLIYITIGFIPVMIMGFRSLIALTILAVIYLYFWCMQLNFKRLLINLTILVIFVICTLQVPLVKDKIEEMRQRQENEQSFENKDYIRYLSFSFYATQIYTEPLEILIGGGVPLVSIKHPVENETDYAKKIAAGYNWGLFWNDLGLIGLAFVVGTATTLLIVFLMLRTSWKCKAKELLFIRCTIMVGILGSIITTQEIYRVGNFTFIALLMYTDYIYRLEHHENRYINLSQRI